MAHKFTAKLDRKSYACCTGVATGATVITVIVWQIVAEQTIKRMSQRYGVVVYFLEEEFALSSDSTIAFLPPAVT